MAKVYHSEIFGLREEKYKWLNKHSIKNVKWQKVAPYPEFYLFIPTDNKLATHYYSFEKITDIFPVNSVGIVTARDNLTITWSKEEIWKRVQNFVKLDPEIAREAYQLGKDARDWKVELAQKDLKDSGLIKKDLVPILYRPFDVRYTYYTGNSRGFHCMPRSEIMQHMLNENIGMLFTRPQSPQYEFSALLSDGIIDQCVVGNKSAGAGISYIAPLYLYPERKEKKKGIHVQMMMFEPETEYATRQPNINTALFEELKTNYKKAVQPEEIFYYIYSVLYSRTYRTKYAEFLSRDFPRVPFTKNYKLFIQLSKLGGLLADLHLLKAKELDKVKMEFSLKGNNKVEKLIYENEKVWINKEQFFDNVKEEVWQYQIGGYHVCEKWLKDRKERILTLEEIQTYGKILTALFRTIELQKEIDKYYEEVEKTV
jgi:predicted helicase